MGVKTHGLLQKVFLKKISIDTEVTWRTPRILSRSEA